MTILAQGPSSLLVRVRRGELNFERLVEILETRGYLTENSRDEGCGMAAGAIEAVRQYDFDALYAVFFPGKHHDIQLTRVATDDGGQKGAFSYALFNASIIDRLMILRILVRENAESAAASAPL